MPGASSCRSVFAGRQREGWGKTPCLSHADQCPRLSFLLLLQVPPARVGTEPAWIHLNVTILSMQPLDTLGMKLTLDMSLIMHWRDPRLDMESLNYAETLNVIHEDNIWRPMLLFQDLTGTEAETKLQWETFVAVLESQPEPDDITRVREGG